MLLDLLGQQRHLSTPPPPSHASPATWIRRLPGDLQAFVEVYLRVYKEKPGGVDHVERSRDAFTQMLEFLSQPLSPVL